MAKNEKICIIGGGPAGLSAAVHLEKNGYTDYAILEKKITSAASATLPTTTARDLKWAQLWVAPPITPCMNSNFSAEWTTTVRNLNAHTADKTASPTIRSIPKRIRSLSRTFFA